MSWPNLEPHYKCLYMHFPENASLEAPRSHDMLQMTKYAPYLDNNFTKNLLGNPSSTLSLMNA